MGKGTEIFNYPAPFKYYTVPTVNNATYKAGQDLASNPYEKYINWPGYSDITNPQNFPFYTTGYNIFISNFNKTYSGTTIKNALEGLPTVSGGYIKFSDPWLVDSVYPGYSNTLANRGTNAIMKERTSPFIPDYTTSFSGDIYKGVFLNQNPTFDPTIPVYSVSVQSPQTIYLSADNKNHDFYFQNWSSPGANFQNSNSTSTPVVFTSSSATVTANLKGSQLSDNTSAIAGNGQRKIVKTGDGTMHLVYESMGHVWYERSLDNGATWSLVNSAPIDTGGGKSPTIDFLNARFNLQNYNTYYVVILFQQKYGSNYKLKALIYKATDQLEPIFQPFQATEIFTSAESYDTYNAKPVVSIDSSSYGVTMVWQYNTGGGLYYSKANINSFHMYGITTPAKIPGTTANSHNPAMAASKIAGGSYLHHICWDENNTIYYVTYNNNLNSFGTVKDISNYLGYYNNSNPSIIAISDGSARVVWQGNMGGYVYEVVFHDPGNDYSYWTFNASLYNGSYYDALYPNLVTTDRQIGYAFAWNEGDNGYFAFQNLSTITGIAKNGGLVKGQYFQICNGPTKYDLYADALNHTVVPRYFDLSNSFGNLGMQKVSKTYASVIGRSIIVNKGGASLFFNVGDLKVDDQYVSFPNIPEDDRNTVEKDMAEYLTSNPFDITDNSKIKYTVRYGINNRKSSVSPLEKDEKVAFGLELVDANTNEELGSFNEVKYNKTSNEEFNDRHYKMNAEGLGVRQVKLKISVDKNFSRGDKSRGDKDVKYAIATTVTNVADSTLQKKTDYEQISLKKAVPVTTYDLAQNYPNPFNPSTVIKYQLPKDGFVTLKIYDILGREVKTLVNEYQNKGRYNVTFDAGNLASGIYIYQLRANSAGVGFVANKKLVLMK